VKKILKALVYTFIAFYFTGSLVNAFFFSGDILYGYILVILALGVVNFVFPHLAAILSLPSRGPFALILSCGITFVMLYLLSAFLPQFDQSVGRIPDLIIFGFVIPSIGLTQMWALLASSALLTFIYKFLTFLGSTKEKK
jgi:hypothetical protein